MLRIKRAFQIGRETFRPGNEDALGDPKRVSPAKVATLKRLGYLVDDGQDAVATAATPEPAAAAPSGAKPAKPAKAKTAKKSGKSKGSGK